MYILCSALCDPVWLVAGLGGRFHCEESNSSAAFGHRGALALSSSNPQVAYAFDSHSEHVILEIARGTLGVEVSPRKKQPLCVCAN